MSGINPSTLSDEEILNKIDSRDPRTKAHRLEIATLQTELRRRIEERNHETAESMRQTVEDMSGVNWWSMVFTLAIATLTAINVSIQIWG